MYWFWSGIVSNQRGRVFFLLLQDNFWVFNNAISHKIKILINAMSMLSKASISHCQETISPDPVTLLQTYDIPLLQLPILQRNSSLGKFSKVIFPSTSSSESTGFVRMYDLKLLRSTFLVSFFSTNSPMQKETHGKVSSSTSFSW